MEEIRCGFCNKLLGKIAIKTAIEKGDAEVKVEIKCKCKNITTVQKKIPKK